VKAVVDTNVLVSGLLWRGNPSVILEAILENRLELCLSEELMVELREVLRRPRLAKHVADRGLDVDWSCEFLRERCFLFLPSEVLVVPGLRDARDTPVLAAARAAMVSLIVSGDNDLLTLKSFSGIPIINPAEAVARLQRR
jgi:putative PIN family toxin of toxin-antitoxin system